MPPIAVLINTLLLTLRGWVGGRVSGRRGESVEDAFERIMGEFTRLFDLWKAGALPAEYLAAPRGVAPDLCAEAAFAGQAARPVSRRPKSVLPAAPEWAPAPAPPEPPSASPHAAPDAPASAPAIVLPMPDPGPAPALSRARILSRLRPVPRLLAARGRAPERLFFQNRPSGPGRHAP